MKDIDLVIIDDIVYETDITPSGSRTSIGGAAYYSSSAVARFSPHVGTIARVGNEFDLNFDLSTFQLLYQVTIWNGLSASEIIFILKHLSADVLAAYVM